MLAVDLEGAADWNLADLKEVPTYVILPVSLVTMGFFVGWPCGQLVRTFVGGGLTVVAIRSVALVSRTSTVEVHVGSLVMTLSFIISRIGELESELASNNSELDATTARLDSTQSCLRFAKDAVSLRGQHIQHQGPQLREVEAAFVVAEAAPAAAVFNFQSFIS